MIHSRPYLIQTENLSKFFENDGIKLQALNNINLSIQKNEFIALMGASGSGKTTLLNILGLLDMHTSGSYSFSGIDLEELNERKRIQLRKNNIGFVFQNFNLIDELTVFENIELPLIYLGLPAPHRKIKVDQIMEKLKLAQKAYHYPSQLSGGFQQKVAIARAIVNSPKLILADEPTGNLDSQNGQVVMQLLRTLNSNGTTILIATHSQKDAEYCHRIIHMLDGRISAQNYGRRKNT